MQFLRRTLLSHDVFPWVLIVGMVSLLVVTLVAVIAEEEVSLDVRSGMTRWRINVGSFPLISRKQDTYVSRLVGLHHEIPAWRTVRTQTLLFPVSPHYRYHGSYHTLKEIELVVSLFSPPEEESRKIAEEVLSCLQRNEPRIADDKVRAWFDQLRLASGESP